MKGEITPAVTRSSQVDLVPGGCSCQTAPETGSAASLGEGGWAAPPSHSVPWEGHTVGSSTCWGCTERGGPGGQQWAVPDGIPQHCSAASPKLGGCDGISSTEGCV